MTEIPKDSTTISYSFDCIRASQPIGDIFICSIPYNILSKITYFDVRRVIQDERDVERYLGIQRPLDVGRVASLQKYVNFRDASFPTGVIIAIEEDYASFDNSTKKLTVSNVKNFETVNSINISNIARVIDGQHRIAGLSKFEGDSFDIPVIVFIGADVSDQAHIFSTVNLEQTKVHKNLVYDLYSLAKSRSPQKTCHNIAVALDQDEEGPFFRRIKRLGGATVGREFEPISQATFVEALQRYISLDPKFDRDQLLRGKPLATASEQDTWKLPFRSMFIAGNDIKIGESINNFFSAVKARWPVAWADEEREGRMLNRTNGFRALMRLYLPLYRKHNLPGGGLPEYFVSEYLKQVPLKDNDFSSVNFVPGSSGEGRLFRVLMLEEEL
jgi:DGQHR domain-containing protein